MNLERLSPAVFLVAIIGCDAGPARSPEVTTTASTSAATTSPTGDATSTKVGATPQPGCPAGMPAQGSACVESDPVCTYGASSSCRCAASSCITPAGPIPGCTPALGWVCRTDGCPWTMTGACKNEGQRCTQDDGMCAYDYECTAGAWKQSGGPGCRP